MPLASWYDHPRDLLQLVNIFRAQMPPPIFGMGHSLGGNNIVNLSLMHPSLFSGVILMDPVIQKEHSKENIINPAYMSTFRRDVWPSREEAAAGLKRNAFYKRYDPRVLEKHVQYMLRDLPTALYPEAPSSEKSRSDSLASASTLTAAPVPPSSPATRPVTLTTPKHQEVFTFMRPKYPTSSPQYDKAALETFNNGPPPRTSYPDVPPANAKSTFYSPAPLTTFVNLPFLRPRVMYVFAKDSFMSEPEMLADKLNTTGTGPGGSRYAGASDVSSEETKTAVQHVMIDDAGHFMAFERPGVVADHLSRWLREETDRWRRHTKAEREEWERIKQSEDGRGGFVISSQYASWMQGDAEAAGLGKPRRSKPEGKGSKL